MVSQSLQDSARQTSLAVKALLAVSKVRTWLRPLALFLLVSAAFLAKAASPSDTQANWPRWRGPHDNGGNEAGAYPVKWNATSNLLWKAALPGKGCSTPIVWGQRIFVTAPVDGQDAALAFDWSGKQLWQTAVGAESPGKHRNGFGSNPSPVTDGQSLFVYFKSGTLAALEFDGKIRWQANRLLLRGEGHLFCIAAN